MSFRRKKSKITAMDDNSKIQVVIHRKFDKNSKDDLFVALENLEADKMDKELEKDPLRLYDANQIERTKIKDPKALKEFDKVKQKQALHGYPEEKLKRSIFELQAKKGLGEKKDFYYDKVRLFNNSLLEIGGEEKRQKRKEKF